MMAHTCAPSTWYGEAGGLRVRANLGYLEDLNLKNTAECIYVENENIEAYQPNEQAQSTA